MKKVAAEPHRDIDFSSAQRGATVPSEPGKTEVSVRSGSALLCARTMNGVHVPQAWGKLDRGASDRTQADRLSLVGHCLDVAAVARALMELPTWRVRLQRLAGREFGATDLDRLTVLAFLHDVGKAGAGFYSKCLSDAAQSAWLRHAHQDRRQLGHTRVVAPLLRFDPACADHCAVPWFIKPLHRKEQVAPRERGWAPLQRLVWGQ